MTFTPRQGGRGLADTIAFGRALAKHKTPKSNGSWWNVPENEFAEAAARERSRVTRTESAPMPDKPFLDR
jgi:hypothetical protein